MCNNVCIINVCMCNSNVWNVCMIIMVILCVLLVNINVY